MNAVFNTINQSIKGKIQSGFCFSVLYEIGWISLIGPGNCKVGSGRFNIIQIREKSSVCRKLCTCAYNNIYLMFSFQNVPV